MLFFYISSASLAMRLLFELVAGVFSNRDRLYLGCLRLAELRRGERVVGTFVDLKALVVTSTRRLHHRLEVMKKKSIKCLIPEMSGELFRSGDNHDSERIMLSRLQLARVTRFEMVARQ